VEVPEDRGRPGGRRISLRVAVLPADAPRAAPDPVFAIAGGPGQSIADVYPEIASAFDRLNRDRDVVLVDQRGTGGSARLACPAIESPGQDLEVAEEELARRVRECAAALSAGADLRQYGTDAFVADLEEVRGRLGYGRVNLVGFSYGTRAALAYARAHPDRVRTLVLDGAAPFEMRIGEDFARDSEAALQAVLRRCADDQACGEAHPDLERRFSALLARLDRHPARVRARHPLTGRPLDLRLDGDAVRQVVLGFLYTPETAALLPPLLAQAAGGDLAPIAAQGILVAADVGAGISRPLQLSVLCAEDVPFYRSGQGAGTFLGEAAVRSFRALCRAWPSEPVGAAFRDMPPLPLPALLLSGGADPVTPPRWAESLASRLPAARHVAIPGLGHGVFARGCVPRLVAEFVSRGTAGGLDVACLAQLRPSPPFVDLQGGSP
jgi:pimeloyl-ACP methyl ester carboxylesterase